jgi:hypothetical protein
VSKEVILKKDIEEFLYERDLNGTAIRYAQLFMKGEGIVRIQIETSREQDIKALLKGKIVKLTILDRDDENEDLGDLVNLAHHLPN